MMDKKKISKKMLYGIIAVVVIVIIAVALYLNSSGPAGKADIAFDDAPVSSAYLSQMYSVANNMALAEDVGLGSASGYPTPADSNISLTQNGLPAVIYVGADYCPFCAATRWGLILALMRFGNFSKLHYMTSSATDYAPNTATFTFYNSSYSSTLIEFLPVETLTNTYKPLQNMSSLQSLVFNKYDSNNTAIPADDRGAIPFIDFGNYSVQVGSEFSPIAINPYNWDQILAFLKNPNSTETQAIIGEANMFTAQICTIDGNKPSNVCSQKFIGLAQSLS